MSLSDQSQQWYPTSVQVTVLQARSLRIKGKNGTNDSYAIMQVAKDKFTTSVAEKSVAPVWKEEATFELPLFHNGNAEKCTLHVHVMHRALVGSDKFLGHAVINLLELSEVKTRNKTEWHKLLDKAGKPDKDRGEVLVDIQFMKNNLTASMFDLSATDKPRSRLGKFKDKVRGKKKEGLSDSASAVVPSFTQVLTDSEGEGEGEGGADKEEKKKKNKLKSLFSPKSNLQRQGLSQSMSVLGPLPEKNSLSGSPSSGLNEDSSEGKNKFKFLTHKRTGSSDSKASQGSLSLGRSKIPAPLAEQSNLCINGSHVYTEDPQPRSARTGSTFSLASSGHGSMEDLRRAQGRKSSSTSMDSLTALKQPSPWAEVESSRAKEEEEDERVKMDKMKRKEEQERKKLEEEERMRKEEQEKRRLGKEEDRLRFEEERIRIEEKMRFEEERIRIEEKMRFEEEEKTRKEEQENRKRMEEKIRVEEESRMMEEERKRRLKKEGEERIKKKEQEMIKLQEEMEEQERWEEEERMRREEHERMKREDRLRKEDERKMREVEERLKREKEERIEEEERIRREQEEDMQRREERERKMREEEERLRTEAEIRREEEEERVKKEQDRLREEEKRVRKAEEDDRLREEMGIKRTEEEERIKREEDRLRKEEEERKIRKEEERIRRLEEDMLRKDEEERKIRKEEERIQRLDEERLRKEEEERKIRKEEERIRRLEEDMLRKDEEERKIRKEEERIRRLDEERLRKEEEERKIRKEEERIRRLEEDMLRKDEEERKIRKEEERIRRLEEERLRKEKAETMRLEEEMGNEQERRRDKKERLRVEDENMKKEELRQEEKRRNAQMEEEQRREEARVPLEEVEKHMEQNCEAKVTVCNNPFEEVSPTSSFDDTSSNNLFEENPMTSTGPISCRINKVSAIKPRPSSWGNPSKPAISSNPFLSSSSPEMESSMDTPRGDRETRDAIDPSTDLVEKKDPATLAPNNQRWACKDNWSSKAKSHCATPNLAKTKPTKPPLPLRRHSSTSLVGSGDDQGSVSGKDHSSVRQNKGPAPLPPDNQRWAHKDNWSSKSNPDSATPTLTPKKPTKPQPPPRRHSATPLVGREHDRHLNESVSQDDSSVRRDKRPAPLPPDRLNQAQSQTQRDHSMTSVNQGHKDRVGASMSKVSQCVVQMITPLKSSSTATTEHISVGQSSTHHGNQAEEPMPSATGGLMVAKHNKGPAPSRPQHTPGKTMPTADMLDEQSITEEHDSSVEFDPNNPFAEDRRMEKSSGRGEEQSLTGERQESLDSHNQQSCTSADADLRPFQKNVVGDTTELTLPDFLPAEDVSCPTKSTSVKRARAPLPPVKKTSTFREEGTGKQSSEKLQSPGAPTSSKLSSGNWVKKQNGGVGVALPCVTLAQPPCFPSPAPSSIPHPEPLKGSGGRRDCPPQTTSSVPGQKTLLHAGALPSITEQCSGEEAGGRGGRPASSTRRPHPVKPLSSLEKQPASNIHEGQAGKSTGILGGLQEKIKVKDTGVKGPYSQLTQEELISLVVKQQEQLSKRDDKIKELEQYIDNLLVRIIEEKPSILMSMNSLK